jgi:adenylate cyclase
MLRPFGSQSRGEQGCPMSDILGEVQAQLLELQQFKANAASANVTA